MGIPWLHPSWSKEYLSTSYSLTEYSVPVMMGRALGTELTGASIRNSTLLQGGG